MVEGTRGRVGVGESDESEEEEEEEEEDGGTRVRKRNAPITHETWTITEERAASGQ